jgi:VanZ family protein
LDKRFSTLWWGGTLAWAALIFCLSSQTFGPDFSRGLLAWTLQVFHLRLVLHTFGLLDDFLRKLAHLIEYGIFGLLLYGLAGDKSRSLWQPRRAAFCILAATAVSLTDEFHQWLVPGRHASLFDCGLDTAGAALAMLVPYTCQVSGVRCRVHVPGVR